MAKDHPPVGKTDQLHMQWISSLLASSSQGMLILDHRLNTIALNQTAKNILDLKPGKISEKYLVHLLPRFVRKNGKRYSLKDNPFSRALTGVKPKTHPVVKYQLASGKYRWLELEIIPLRGTVKEINNVLVVLTDISRQVEKEEYNRHLTSVLKAIRNVNQLITQEKNPQKLIEKACELMVESRGFFRAQIILISEGKLTGYAYSGGKTGTDKFKRQLENNVLPVCVKKLVTAVDPALIIEGTHQCSRCALGRIHKSEGVYGSRLEHSGITYGFILALIPRKYLHDPEEFSLFREVSSDLAYALSAINQGERQKKALLNLFQFHAPPLTL